MLSMSFSGPTRNLRPFLSSRFRQLRSLPACSIARRPSTHHAGPSDRDVSLDYEKRIAQLRAVLPAKNWYPRLGDATNSPRYAIAHVREACTGLKPGDTDVEQNVSVAGRVKSVRIAGSKLVFVDIEDDTSTSLQLVCSLKRTESSDESPMSFHEWRRLIRRGDYYAATGHPHRTSTGEFSIQVTEIPTMLAPALHQIPDQLEDPETRARHRHVDMMVNPEAIATLRVRHLVEKHLLTFFDERGFVSVKTPILDSGAGGAIARPFVTTSTEFPDRPLNLRIAPELWLKRLVMGGLNKVYEIGPSFRNEGVDGTHNPEFNTCEFYEAYATLEDLLATTEELLRTLAEGVSSNRQIFAALSVPHPSIFADKFKRLEFIPALEERLGESLPDLESSDAAENLRALFQRHSIPIPAQPTLPRLLDSLSSHTLEPMTNDGPTFILHPPAALSPLAKHFICAQTKQRVAARAELFYQGREYANMYEEENSPFAQRDNFTEQAQYKAELMRRRHPGAGQTLGEIDREAGTEIDESFLSTLEWGLPPTGGWGCGIDRLVMLFAGRDRIADVLAFGTLRNVVAQTKRD